MLTNVVLNMAIEELSQTVKFLKIDTHNL